MQQGLFVSECPNPLPAEIALYTNIVEMALESCNNKSNSCPVDVCDIERANKAARGVVSVLLDNHGNEPGICRYSYYRATAFSVYFKLITI